MFHAVREHCTDTEHLYSKPGSAVHSMVQCTYILRETMDQLEQWRGPPWMILIWVMTVGVEYYVEAAGMAGNSNAELVFLNLYGAQESMPRLQFRQPM